MLPLTSSGVNAVMVCHKQQAYLIGLATLSWGLISQIILLLCCSLFVVLDPHNLRILNFNPPWLIGIIWMQKWTSTKLRSTRASIHVSCKLQFDQSSKILNVFICRYVLGHEGLMSLAMTRNLADRFISDEANGCLECAHHRGAGLGC